MAKQARNLYKMIGRPSYADFVSIIKNNLLPHANITTKGIVHAETIFGKELGSLQGKTMRKSPKTVIADYIEIPPDVLEVHREVMLAADIMSVDRDQFLITTSRSIQFTTVERIETKENQSLIKGLTKVVNLYKRRGMMVQVRLVDNEFESIRGPMMEIGIDLNVCAPNEHVPEIERKIQTVKERIRGIITMLPFQKIPMMMVTHAVTFSTMWLNYFPPKGGVSPTLSPQTIVTGLTPNAEKHCRLPFGAYAQVHVEVSPSNDVIVSRTVGGISLGPTRNIQGIYKFMSLLTGKLIKARSFTPLPMPEDVVTMVESIAAGSHDREENFSLIDCNKDYIPTHEDDVSMGSMEYSGVSTQELLDILEDAGMNDDEIPEYIENEGVVDEGVENQGVEESPYDASIHDEDKVEIGQLLKVDEVSEQTDHSSRDQDSYSEDDKFTSSEIAEGVDGKEVTDRTHYVTRSGRNVKLRKDLFDNYQLIQKLELENEHEQFDDTPTTQ
jgi:hypothetical protein